jgi:hypothetical protein
MPDYIEKQAVNVFFYCCLYIIITFILVIVFMYIHIDRKDGRQLGSMAAAENERIERRVKR